MPLERYQALLDAGTIVQDPVQRAVAGRLDVLARALERQPAPVTEPGRGLLGRLIGRTPAPAGPVPKGLYIHGGVGRGKSMLMDLFFEGAPVARKRRVHFHAFMQEAHAAIHAARARGTDDPVRPVADAIADDATLLAFDEMQITDITDAMLVGRLFQRLFERGVVVVATSNRHPDELYRDGLSRQLFLGFIALLKERMVVHHLEGATDHRLDRLAGAPVYHTPLGPAATAALDAAWERLARGPGTPLTLHVQGRDLVLARHWGGVARASFDELCGRPLGPADYLAIAEALDVLILDDVPVMSRARRDEARRFLTLADTLYEAKVRLIVSAAAEPDGLYVEGEGALDFRRTASRLQEMRSAGWGAR